MLHTLSIVWDVDPVWIRIGTFDIRYYGLMWAVAILIAAKFFDNFVKREGLPAEVSESVFLYGTLATIIGARLGHCLFYDPAGYLSQPWTIITGFRDGGMASHGAAIGLLIGLWLFSRRNRLPYLWSLDRIMVGVTIGGAAVRFGNLLNSEIFGTATALPWGFEFVRSAKWLHEYAPAAVHPTQIYEAVCYLATFAVMLWMYYGRDLGRRRPGAMFGVGLIGIFLTRFVIEFIKTEQESFEVGWALDMGQWLSIPFILLGGWMIWRVATRPAAAKGAPASFASTASAKPGTERGARPARKPRRRREPKQEAGREAKPEGGDGSAAGAGHEPASGDGRKSKPRGRRSSEQTRSLKADAKAETKAARRPKPKRETEPGKDGEPGAARKPKGAPGPEQQPGNVPGSGEKPETEEAAKPARRPRRRRGPKPEAVQETKPAPTSRPETAQRPKQTPKPQEAQPAKPGQAPKQEAGPQPVPGTKDAPKPAAEQQPEPAKKPASEEQPKPARRPRRRRGPKPEAEQAPKQGAGVESTLAQAPKLAQEPKPDPVQTLKPERQPKPVQRSEPAQRPNPEQEPKA